MNPCRPGYTSILVESFYSNEPGHRYPIEVRPVPRGPFPVDMLIECPMEMRTDYPVGTVFRVCVRPKQKLNCRPHLYTSYQWPFEIVRRGEKG